MMVRVRRRGIPDAAPDGAWIFVFGWFSTKMAILAGDGWNQWDGWDERDGCIATREAGGDLKFEDLRFEMGRAR